MLKLYRESVVLYENPDGGDSRPLVSGMTETDRLDILEYNKNGGFHLYWGSRASEYYWGLKEMRRGPANPLVLDLGSGDSMWPCFIADRLGATVEAVDLPGKRNPTAAQIPKVGKVNVQLTGIEGCKPPTGYNVITAISSIEHFSPAAKGAVARMINGLPVGGLLVATVEFQTGNHQTHECMAPHDMLRTFDLDPPDLQWMLEEARRLGLYNRWTVAMISGKRI